MRAEPSQKLDPRIKSVWRINEAILLVVIFLFCFIPFLIVSLVDPEASWSFVVLIVEVICFVVSLIFFIGILPTIRYVRWKYELSNDFLDIQKGIIWRTRTVIPFIRVQNTDTEQGPILRAFGLSNVTISTAAGSHTIPGLEQAEAQLLRDKAAELARIAREDV